MKLSIDISELIQLGRKMLPEGVDFFLDETPVVFDPIDIELSAGKEVRIEDLDPGSGLISYQGRQVLLYIRDHTGRYDAAIEDGEKGKRFHIAWCRTLDDMRQKIDLNGIMQQIVLMAYLKLMMGSVGAKMSLLKFV